MGVAVDHGSQTPIDYRCIWIREQFGIDTGKASTLRLLYFMGATAASNDMTRWPHEKGQMSVCLFAKQYTTMQGNAERRGPAHWRLASAQFSR